MIFCWRQITNQNPLRPSSWISSIIWHGAFRTIHVAMCISIAVKQTNWQTNILTDSVHYSRVWMVLICLLYYEMYFHGCRRTLQSVQPYRHDLHDVTAWVNNVYLPTISHTGEMGKSACKHVSHSVACMMANASFVGWQLFFAFFIALWRQPYVVTLRSHLPSVHAMWIQVRKSADRSTLEGSV